MYSTFVLHIVAEQNETIRDIEVELHHVIIIIIETTTHKADIPLYLEITLFMTNVLLLHTIIVHDMTFTIEILDLIVLLTDPHNDHLVDMTLAKDTDSAPILEITTSQKIRPHSDHLQDQKILEILDLDHTQT